MNGDDEVVSGVATGASTLDRLGLVKTSKRRKPKRPSLLDKAAERGTMGYSPFPTTAGQANATSGVIEE